MPTLWGQKYSRSEVLARVGDLSQLGGARSYRIDGGPGDGVPVVEVDTGSGFRFTVVPGRALDISGAWYRGIPLGHRTITGEMHGAYYEPHDRDWIRSTVLGLLVTCGLDNIGNAGEDESGYHGLHGRLSNLAASNVLADGEWNGDEYDIWVQGKVRQGALYTEKFVLQRRISTRLGATSLQIQDTVTNLGHTPEPMMIMYHMNPGWPVIDQGARLHVRSRSRRPMDQYAAAADKDWANYSGPAKDWVAQVWTHDVDAGPDGTVYAALVNPSFKGGFGLEFTWNKRQLPFLNHWRQLGQGDYVTGIEPGNASVFGRVQNRADGTLPILEPGESRTFDLAIGVLDGAKAVEAAVQRAGG